MPSSMKIAALASFAALGLAAAPSQADPLSYAYSYAPDPNTAGAFLESLTISNPFSYDLTNVGVSEALLSNPSVGGTTTTALDGLTPLAVAAGKSITSGMDFALPFGSNPAPFVIDPQTGAPAPFVLSGSATGGGHSYGFTLTQGFNPDGSPAAVPESGPLALLAAGLGLLGIAGLRRKRAN